MNDEGVISGENGTSHAGSMLKRSLAIIGKWTIGLWQWPVQFISDAVAVIWQGLRPVTWRRSIRAEFMRQCYQVGARALPFILVCGTIIGFAIIAQAFHWLRVFGSTVLYGEFISGILIREIAPVLVGLIVIGRSGVALIVELGTLKTKGQVDMLDAQGIDPFLYLVVPRVLAFAVSVFSLTTAFVAVALLSGYASGTLIGLLQLSFFDFIERSIGAMGWQIYVLFTLKTVAIGFAVALISCKTALSLKGASAKVLEIMPLGFAKSVLATLMISIALTILS